MPLGQLACDGGPDGNGKLSLPRGTNHLGRAGRPQLLRFVLNVCTQFLLYDSFHGFIGFFFQGLLAVGAGREGGHHVIKVLIIHGYQGLQDAQHQNQAAGELAHPLHRPRRHQGLRRRNDHSRDGDAEQPGSYDLHRCLLSHHRRHRGDHGHHQQHRAGGCHGQDQTESRAQGLNEAGDPSVGGDRGRQGRGTFIH